MAGALAILYDARCPLCTFQTRMLTWLDWFRTTRMLPLDHEQARALAGDIPHEQLVAAIHCIDQQGRVVRGARALRRVCIRMPLLIPLALVLWIPGVIWVAEALYAWVSRNRMVFSRLFGCKGACKIMPARQRDEDILGHEQHEGSSAKEAQA